MFYRLEHRYMSYYAANTCVDLLVLGKATTVIFDTAIYKESIYKINILYKNEQLSEILFWCLVMPTKFKVHETQHGNNCTVFIDIGHSRTGEISHYNHSLLQRSHGLLAHV